MTRRPMLRRFDVRPFAVLTVILLVCTVGGRLVGGVLSVLLPATVVVLGVLVAVTVRTVRRDTRRSAALRAEWALVGPGLLAGTPAGAAPVEGVPAADQKDAA